jgi:DNA-binding transcriptional regulator YdaS (Cro superfamily)
MVLMVFDYPSGLYVPIFYILLQGKHEDIYYHALQNAICASNWELKAATYTCDFEAGLINAADLQFSKYGKNVLCDFHQKQALWKKCVSINIPFEYIDRLLGNNGKGLFNILTVIPVDQIKKYGIPYVRHKMCEGNMRATFNSFWSYFNAYYMIRVGPEKWNINEIMKKENDDDILINRTNNPLESFNSKLVKELGIHPNMQNFVTGIKKISAEYVAMIEQVKKGQRRRPVYDTPRVNEIPPDYEDFCRAYEHEKQRQSNNAQGKAGKRSRD